MTTLFYMPRVLSTTFQLQTSEFANSFTVPASFSFCMNTFKSNLYTLTSNKGLASQNTERFVENNINEKP